VIFTVTDLVKRIDGRLTVVAWDRDFQDGDLAEAELALELLVPVFLSEDFDVCGPDSSVFPLQIVVGTSDVAVHHMHLSRSFRTKTRNCLKSPEVQSASSDSSIVILVVIRQESSVLSVKRTWMYSRPSSKLCSTQCTTLPCTPR
jgi:hypothetical protein